MSLWHACGTYLIFYVRCKGLTLMFTYRGRSWNFLFTGDIAGFRIFFHQIRLLATLSVAEGGSIFVPWRVRKCPCYFHDHCSNFLIIFLRSHEKLYLIIFPTFKKGTNHYAIWPLKTDPSHHITYYYFCQCFLSFRKRKIILKSYKN